MNRYASLPPFPDRVVRLEELAIDLWWSWHTDAREVFRHLDYALWRATAHNPVRMLRILPREKLEEAKRSAEVTHDHPEGIKGAQHSRQLKHSTCLFLTS